MLGESAWQVCQRAAVGQQYRDPHYDPMAALPYFRLNVRSIAIHDYRNYHHCYVSSGRGGHILSRTP